MSSVASLGFISFSDTIPALQIGSASHNCAVFLNARVRCWGNNAYHQLGDNSTVNKGNAVDIVQSSVFVTFGAAINTIPIIAVDVGA